MKEFKVRSGNFLKSSNSTSNMMYTILVVLIPFIIFSTYKNGIYPIIKGYGNLYLVFKPLIFASVASLFCIVTEYLYYYIRKDKRSFYKLFSESYAIIPGVFLSLVIPINTPIWLVIIGSIIASLSKVLMGGLGKNKLNPALVGSLFITIIFSSLTGGYLNPYEYGIWITLNSILTWINYFDIGLGNGLRNKLTEALAIKDYNMAQMYVSTALVLLFFIALILYALFLILSSFISWYDILNVESSIRNLDTIVMIVMFCMCICFVLRIIGTIFLSYQNTWVNDFLTFAGSLLAFVWIYILTCTSEGSLMKVAIAFSLSPVIVYLIAFPITFH